MPKMLHDERWPELAPEFEAYAHLTKAKEALGKGSVVTAQAALTLRHVDTALRALHPATQCVEGRAEFAERKADAEKKAKAAK